MSIYRRRRTGPIYGLTPPIDGPRPDLSLTLDLTLTHTLVWFRVSGFWARGAERGARMHGPTKQECLVWEENPPSPQPSPAQGEGESSATSVPCGSPGLSCVGNGERGRLDRAAKDSRFGEPPRAASRCSSDSRSLISAGSFAVKPYAHQARPHNRHAAERSPSPERERVGVRAGVPPHPRHTPMLELALPKPRSIQPPAPPNVCLIGGDTKPAFAPNVHYQMTP